MGQETSVGREEGELRNGLLAKYFRWVLRGARQSPILLTGRGRCYTLAVSAQIALSMVPGQTRFAFAAGTVRGCRTSWDS